MKNGIKEKIKGNANQAIGKSKAVIGKMFDDKELEAKGKAQNIKGSGQEFIGNAKDTLKKRISGRRRENGSAEGQAYKSNKKVDA